MLAFLTDAHISPDVAEQARTKRPGLIIHSLRDWRGGNLLQADDDVILAAAQEAGLTLVTYDQRTIVPLLTQWAMVGRDHAGVLFVDHRSIAQGDVGGQIRALLKLWDETQDLDWANAVSYLRSDPWQMSRTSR